MQTQGITRIKFILATGILLACSSPATAKEKLPDLSYAEIVDRYPEAFLSKKNTHTKTELTEYAYEDIVKEYPKAFCKSNPGGEDGRVIFTSATESIMNDEGVESGTYKKNWFKDLDIHGYVRTRHYLDLDKDYDEESVYESRNDIRLEKNMTFTPNLTGRVSLDGKYHFLVNEADGYETAEGHARLWEGYLYAKLGKLDIKVGQQAIRWGKSDEQNPTDVFTPEDFSESLNFPSRADRKIPVPMLKMDYYLGDANTEIFEVIWIPFFEPDRIAEAGLDYESFVKRAYHRVYGVAIDEKRPRKRMENSTGAIKWTHIGENADFSLSYSYHFNQNPSYHILPLEGRIEEKYFRQHTIGGDFETTVGKLGMRGEGAFTTNKLYVNVDPFDEDKVFKNNAFVGIVGCDYNFVHDIYVNLQYMAEYVFDYGHFYIEQDYSDSILWKISKSFMRDKLEFETIGRWFFSRRDYYLTLRGRYDFTDQLSCTLGMDVYDGDEDTTFGQADRTDQVFMHLKYAF